MAAFVMFTASSQTFALPAADVDQVLRMAAPTRVPGAPAWVRGVLNVHGELVPVLDVAARLGAAPRDARPDEQLLVLSRGGRRVALQVERVLEVRELPDAGLAHLPGWAAGAPPLAGAALLPDGVILVQSIEPWLAAAEAARSGASP